MTYDFEPLSCPMCGGELMYSEGTHDLCCVKNASELSSLETGRGRSVETTVGSGRTLHELRAGYGSMGRNDETPDEWSTDKTNEQAVENFGNEHINRPGLAEGARAETDEYRANERDMEKSEDADTKRAGFAEGGAY